MATSARSGPASTEARSSAMAAEEKAQADIEKFHADALSRRGNAAMQKDVEDAMRSFNPQDQRNWDQKYKFFSGNHMKQGYRTFAKARHDPFNKDPAWGRSIMQKIGAACQSKGGPESMFRTADATGDGTLNRAELKRALLATLPTLSDLEITSIFNIVDEDRSDEVSVAEFCDAMRKACSGTPVAPEVSKRWRNPVHRVTRLTPATIEGWDHISGPPRYAREADLCDDMINGITARLRDAPIASARGAPGAREAEAASGQELVSKHHYFGGGHDHRRFRRQEWNQARANGFSTPRGKAIVPIANFPDPGPDVRPGWHMALAASGVLSNRGCLSAR